MKRFLTVFLAVVTIASAPVALAKSPILNRTPHGPCVFRQVPKPSMSATHVHYLMRSEIACAARRFGVSETFAQCIALRESGDWPWAGPYHSSKGVFQQNIGPSGSWWQSRARTWLPRAWFSRYAAVVEHGWFNARANILVSIRMAHSGGWGPWTTSGGC